ncbi:MAG: hypothetical protein FWD48_11950 [Oscillospiraceae bacterium]|nr:hypothetical protein [Oscillospiraceae bacterium]
MNFDLRDFEVARAQFFTSANIVSVTFTRKYLRFSNCCVRRFADVKYIELLVQPDENRFAVRACLETDKNAIRWLSHCDGKAHGRAISGSAFIGTLYELFGWEAAFNYRFRGEIIHHDNDWVILFNANEPEVMIRRDSDNIPQDFYLSKYGKLRCIALPSEWQNSFGEQYRELSGQTEFFIGNTFAEYNKYPDINPTSHEAIGENIEQLLGEFNHDNI